MLASDQALNVRAISHQAGFNRRAHAGSSSRAATSCKLHPNSLHPRGHSTPAPAGPRSRSRRRARDCRIFGLRPTVARRALPGRRRRISHRLRRAGCRAAAHRCWGAWLPGGRPPSASRPPRPAATTEPVELGDHLLRRRGNGLTGPLAQVLQLPGHLGPDMSSHLILRQAAQLGPASRILARRSSTPRGPRGSSRGTRPSPLPAGPVPCHASSSPASGARAAPIPLATLAMTSFSVASRPVPTLRGGLSCASWTSRERKPDLVLLGCCEEAEQHPGQAT